MNPRPPLAIAALLAVLPAGCYAPPARVAPAMPSVDGKAPASRRLSAALVYTENARNARRYLMGIKYADTMTGLLFDRIEDVFRRDFRAMTKADSFEEAKASGADVVVLVDVYAKVFQGFMNASNHLDLGAVFFGRDGAQIDSIAAAQDASGLSNPSPTGPMAELAEKTPAKLEAALLASAPLQAYPPVAVPAPAAAVAQAELPPSDVDVPDYHAPESPSDFALVIGIDGYQSLPRAEFAERDARAVRAHLLALGYPPRNVVTLLGTQATKTGIEKNLESWLPRVTDSGSRVLVYFSGHGAPEVSTGKAYLVPWDGDVKYLAATGYPVQRLYDQLNRLKAGRVLVAMDSCFSGAGGRSLLPRGARPLINRVETGGSGRVVALTASAADEISGSDAKTGHGVFTYYLLKGLGLRKGETTARELHRFLSPKVQDAARAENREQTPQLLAPAGVDVPLR